MRGAREYKGLFGSHKQYGRLYIIFDSHARGVTLYIYLLPKDKVVDESSGLNGFYTLKNKVEVYGVVGGNPGWTESYGWIHDGPWVKDFEELVKSKRDAIAYRESVKKTEKQTSEDVEKRRIKELLSDYE